MIPYPKWDVNARGTLSCRLKMPYLIVKEDLGLHYIEDVLFFDTSCKEKFVGF
nr:hypothetical protein GCM10017606_29600 [Microbacterium terregens]